VTSYAELQKDVEKDSKRKRASNLDKELLKKEVYYVLS
jgi:hypothetical protein